MWYKELALIISWYRQTMEIKNMQVYFYVYKHDEYYDFRVLELQEVFMLTWSDSLVMDNITNNLM